MTVKSRTAICSLALCLFATGSLLHAQVGPQTIVVTEQGVSPEERQKIEAAVDQVVKTEGSFIKPKKPRKLLVFDLNSNYQGHSAIPYANIAFKAMGEKTGAFEVIVSHDPRMFEEESLSRFDAVCFNNTVGNVFADGKLRENLERFVRRGGGLLGIHGASVAFVHWSWGDRTKNIGTEWPVFHEMLGARGAEHRAKDERVNVKVEEPGHPLLKGFSAEGFEWVDEFYRFPTFYSREKSRILLSIDTEKTDLGTKKERPDEDYGIAWVKDYGQGRVFYCSIGHQHQTFWNPMFLRLYLAGIQFVLGDLDAPTLPSAAANDAIRTHEKLGWKLVMPGYTFHKFSLFDTIDKTTELGLAYCGGLSFQKVGGGINKNFDPKNLEDKEIEAIRQKLQSKGIRMVSYYYHELPGDEAACRKLFEFAEKMGIRVFLTEPKPESLDVIEKLCDEFGIDVALHNHDKKATPAYWSPGKVLEHCKDRSPGIGVCADVGYWIRDGVDPVEAVKKLGRRIRVVQVHDLDWNGKDVPWGTGTSSLGKFFEELARQGVRPLDVDVEYSDKFDDNMKECRECIDFFNKTVSEILSTRKF